MQDIDKLPHGPAWEVYEINTTLADGSTNLSYLFSRNIVEVALELVANPAFNKFMHYAPERLWTTADCKTRAYDNPWSGDWWWRMQVSAHIRLCINIILTVCSYVSKTDTGRLFRCSLHQTERAYR